MYYDDGFARTWHRTRRVAVAEVLRFYLERRLPEGVVTAGEVQSAFSLLGDRAALVEMLDKLDAGKLENLLSRLEMFEDDFPPEHVEAAIGALLDQVGRLREGKQHFFDFGADLALDRVVLRLLRRQEQEAERESLITRLLPTLRWLSAQRALILIAEAHNLASEPTIASWKAALTARFANGNAGALAGERHLGMLIAETIEAGGPAAERARELIYDDRLLVRVLASVTREQSSWSLGDVASVQQARLPWEHLLRLFGSERFEQRVLEARARVVPAEVDARENTALDLAVQYASGWRPKDLFGVGEDSPAQAPATDVPMSAPDLAAQLVGEDVDADTPAART